MKRSTPRRAATAADHPRIDLLRMKDIHAGRTIEPGAVLASRKAVAAVKKVMADVQPLGDWLAKYRARKPRVQSPEPLSRIPHPRGDAVHCHDECVVQPRIVVALSKPADDFDLHQVDRIHVGIAHVDRAPQDGVSFQQTWCDP